MNPTMTILGGVEHHHRRRKMMMIDEIGCIWKSLSKVFSKNSIIYFLR